MLIGISKSNVNYKYQNYIKCKDTKYITKKSFSELIKKANINCSLVIRKVF